MFQRSTALRRGLAGLLLATTACLAWSQSSPIPPQKLSELETQASSDPAEQRKRWGPWVDLMGQFWVLEGLPNTAGFELEWVVPGAAVKFSHFWCYQPGTPCTVSTGYAMYNPAPPRGFLLKMRYFDVLWADGRPATEGSYDEVSGQLYVSTSGSDMSRYLFDRATGKGFFGGYHHRRGVAGDLPTIASFGVQLAAHRAPAPAQAAAAPASAPQAQAAASNAGPAAPEAQIKHRGLPEAKLQALQALRTTDPTEIRRRWGDLAGAVGKAWAVQPGEQPQWRVFDWVVQGAVMRYQRGQCVGGPCHTSDIVVVYDPQKQQLDFHLPDGNHWASAQVATDGSVGAKFMARESFAFEAPDLLRVRGSWLMRPVTAKRITELSKGTTDVRMAMAAQAAGEARSVPAGTERVAADAKARVGSQPTPSAQQPVVAQQPTVPQRPAAARTADAILQGLPADRLAQVQSLRTSDAGEIGRRWGDLRQAVGKHWMAQASNQLEWRRFTWVVEGAAMEYQRGICMAGRCQDYQMLIVYQDQRRQLDFVLHDQSVWASGAPGADGAIDAAGRESFKMEPDGRLRASYWTLQPVAANQVLAASGGNAQVQAEAPAPKPSKAGTRARPRAAGPDPAKATSAKK
jgi:hypothetical protein